MSQLESMLALQIKCAKLPAPEREYRFDSKRRWRYDFAWPSLKVAAECEGGTWTGGRHTTGKGFAADCEKYNTAALQGWQVFRFTGELIKSGEALKTLEQALPVTDWRRALGDR